MKFLNLKLENQSFILQLEPSQEEETNFFLTQASTIPVTISLNGENYVLLKEELFDDFLAVCDEDCHEESYHDDCYPEETDYYDESVDGYNMDDIMADILSLMALGKLDCTALIHLEEVISAYQVLETAKQVYSGDFE